MSIVEYNEIVKSVNNDSLERLVFNEIEKYCRERGREIYQLDYSEYIRMRNYLIKINKEGLMKKFENTDSNSKIKKNDHENRNQIVGTLAVICIFLLTSMISDVMAFISYSCIAITAIIGFGTLPIIQNSKFMESSYNSDYVDRYFRAREDARINTRAYLDQAWLHSGEIRILNERINGKR